MRTKNFQYYKKGITLQDDRIQYKLKQLGEDLKVTSGKKLFSAIK